MGGTLRVNIGLPVYNGENFIEETLDSILSQTYKDFELIISDNASTDKTMEICKAYAERDSRIRYYRNDTNLGGSRNYNKAFELSNSEYFKWAAHDDIIGPTFLEQCVDVLERDPSIVLCYSKMQYIDEKGNVLKDYGERPNYSAPQPSIRFSDFVLKGTGTFEHFGLVRSSVLKKITLYEAYSLTDNVILAELSLQGKFFEIPEILFFIRSHAEQCTQKLPDRVEQTIWYDTRKHNKLAFPHWKAIAGYARSINNASLTYDERLKCYLILGKWMKMNNRYISGDLKAAFKKSIMKIAQT
jgi:glycosyltransferase involved in cell wall biosynthesis